MRLLKTVTFWVIFIMTVSVVSADEHFLKWYDIPSSYGNEITQPATNSDFTLEKICWDNICMVGGDEQTLVLKNYDSAKNPTYNQLIAFLKQDTTDENWYSQNYVCGDFAETVHNNAEKYGIKCAWVACIGVNHAFNAVQTTDRGLVYFDCTGQPRGATSEDKIVNVDIGEPITETYLFKDGVVTMPGSVEQVLIYW